MNLFKKVFIFCCSFLAIHTYAVGFVNQQKFEIYASVVPINQAAISSEITSKITKIYFKSGQTFDKGDILVSFDCRTVILQAQKAKAVLKGTQANLESNLKLSKLDSISDVELKQSESENKISQVEVQLLENEILKCNILAPYDGEVTATIANENEIVKTDDPLIEIVSNDALELQMYMPSSWLSTVHVHEKFIFVISELNQLKVTGSIIRIVGKIDTSSQSVLVFGQFDDPVNDIVAGMSGVVIFSSRVYRATNEK